MRSTRVAHNMNVRQKRMINERILETVCQFRFSMVL